MRVRLTKDFTFEAAQTLPNAPEGHKCRRMHGHSFKVEISVEGEVDRATGWFYDHAEIGAAMKPLHPTTRSRLSQRNRGAGEPDDRKHGGVALAETSAALSRPVRNRGPRDPDGAVRLSRRIGPCSRGLRAALRTVEGGEPPTGGCNWLLRGCPGAKRNRQRAARNLRRAPDDIARRSAKG